MSLLTIVQDAMVQAGFDSPSIVMASSDATVTLFKQLAQVEGDSLSRAHDWRGLKVLASMTGDGTSTEYSLPADFSRFMTAYPFWQQDTPSVPLIHVTDDEMQALKVAAASPSRPVWRLFGDNIEFYPAPTDGYVIKSEYRSAYWIVDGSDSSRNLRWTNDTDSAVIPERLISLGCVWRYKQAKGFDYAEDYRTYRIEMAKEASAENGRQTITMRESFPGDYLDYRNGDYRVVV